MKVNLVHWNKLAYNYGDDVAIHRFRVFSTEAAAEAAVVQLQGRVVSSENEITITRVELDGEEWEQE